MKFADLNKEQKQKLLLAGIVVVGVIYSFLIFVVRPYVNGGRQTALELQILRGKMREADQTVRRETQTREQLVQAREEIGKAFNECIPPLDNPLSWVAQRVYRGAREVGVEIESVADLGTVNAPWTQQPDNHRVYIPYTVRIVTQCGFHEMVRLIKALESSNPYLCVSEIQIAAQDSDVEKHRISLSVEWPFWQEAVKAQELAKWKEDARG